MDRVVGTPVWLGAAALSAIGLFGACATLADGGGGDQNLPNAVAGPFRAIEQEELGNVRSAPNAIDDDEELTRDPSVLDEDGDPATYDVLGFFAKTVETGADPDPLAAPTAIVRHRALDARSFDRSPEVVLQPADAWEGGTIGAPHVIRVGADLFLYYEAAGGIGLARSVDGGAAFTREAGPVLSAAPVGGGANSPGVWEAGAVPRSPGVVRLWDGSFRMFYEVPGEDGAASIGEATSSDGVSWTRIGQGPALAPSVTGLPLGEGEEPYDSASVGAPFPLLAESAEGRQILRVYYAARDRLGGAVVGLAARVGADGPLERAASPVFGTSGSLGPRDPCVVDYGNFALLFVTQRAGRSAGKNYPAVGVGVAPAQATLPPANPR